MPDAGALHPETEIGRVHYKVAHLERVATFYREVLGFHLLWQRGSEAALGTPERELLRLTEEPGARQVRGRTGLYHTAFLLPTRWDLAHLVRRLIEARTPLHGTSNHGTHLAIYLPDPEGNGIELAWDFPKEAWPMRNGKMDWRAMPREGVNLGELLEELERDPSPWPGLPREAKVGHIHLHVSDLHEALSFYHHALGFDVTADGWEIGALFFSAGGYHHHVGTNIWRGQGALPPPPDASGLCYFTLLLPGVSELDRAAGRLERAGFKGEAGQEGVLFKDPSENGVMLTANLETQKRP